LILIKVAYKPKST